MPRTILSLSILSASALLALSIPGRAPGPSPARAAEEEAAPQGAPAESPVKLLYTVNNVGFTGTCG